MKKSLNSILFAFIVLALGAWLIPQLVHADDYVDDIYYIPLQEKSAELKPYYNKDAKEIIFIEDSTTQPNDTVVKAIIRDRT